MNRSTVCDIASVLDLIENHQKIIPSNDVAFVWGVSDAFCPSKNG